MASGGQGQVGMNHPGSKGQAKTLQGMAGMDRGVGTSNPYEHYNDNNYDTISIDDGINMDESPELSEKDRDEEAILNAMPSKEEVAREFEEYLELMFPLTDQAEDDLRKKTLEEKWKIVFNEHQRECVYPVKTYITNLQKHLNMHKKKVSYRKKVAKDGLGPLAFWLGKLKHDLKMSHESFALEFVNDDNNGIDVLIDILKEIQHDQQATQTTKKSKIELYQQCQRDEYDCLLCLKFATKAQEGVDQLVKYTGGIDTILPCLVGPWVKTRVTTLELLTVVCDASTGHQQVLDAFSSMQIKMAEPVLFKNLVAMLSNHGHVHFQTTCVRFFNKLLAITENGNFRVYLQHQIRLAGFDPDDLDRYFLGQGVEYDCLQQELDTWRKNYINLNSSRQDMVDLEGRNIYLRQEIDRLQLQLTESATNKEKWSKTERDLREQGQQLRSRAAELQDLVDKLTVLLKKKTGLNPEEENIHVDQALRALDNYQTVRGIKGTLGPSSVSSVEGQGSFSPPPVPPELPPIPGQLSATVRMKVAPKTNVNLPLLQWTPIPAVSQTLFEDIDDEAMLREIDFSELEDRFQLPLKMEGAESRMKRELAIQNTAKNIQFVEVKRANNMIITQRRTGMTANEIREAIDKCQIDRLSGEYCELLLKYMPTKEEYKQLAKHRDKYHMMGEAEKFLFQLARVERLETKLAMLAFMGIFEEMTTSIKPDMGKVYSSSESVLNSRRLKKVFEIILAFGNYMNSSKRGFIFGFKLESLSKLKDVKSTDKTTTLLHYLVELIETNYPEVAKFYDEIEIGVTKGVSYQSIASDIHGLRKGLDLIKYERQKQPGNATIETFLRDSSNKVTELWEYFRNMESSYRRVCLMFGESHKTIEPDELFKYLQNFIADFKGASLANYKAANPETVISPLPTPRKAQAKTLAAEAAVVAASKPKSTIPSQASLRPAPTVFTFPATSNDNNTKAVETEVTYDDTEPAYADVAVKESARESNIYADPDDVQQRSKVAKSNSKMYKAKAREPIYSSVVKQPSTKSTAAKDSEQPQLPPRKRLPRLAMDSGGSVRGKGQAPAPPGGGQNKAARADSQRMSENIYQDIPADAVRSTANGSIPSSSKPKGQAPAPPATGKGLANAKRQMSAEQVSEALAQLDNVVNNPYWTAEERIPEATEDSKL